MTTITTTLGDMDESLLMKRNGLVDNEDELTTTVEYCLAGCTSNAHRTGIPESPGYFCSRNVHRSVNMTLKKNVSIEGVAAKF